MDDDALDSFEDDDPDPSDEDTPLVKRLRRQIRKQAKEAADGVETARKEGYDAAKTGLERSAKAGEIAKGLGYAKLGTRFLTEHPEGEITEEALKGWLTEDLGLEIKEAGAESEAELAAPQGPSVAAFHNVGGTAASQSARISYERYREMVEDPTQHRQAMEKRAAGLVDD